MFGELEHELELNVPAGEAWDLFGTLRIVKVFEQDLSHLLQKVELIEGDGGVGTVLKLTFQPDFPGPVGFKEKFTKVDNEKRIKEMEVVEGGYLELGFTLFRFRLEIIEKGHDSSIIRSTIQYEVKEEAKTNALLLNTQNLAAIAQVGKIHLNKNRVDHKEAS